MHEWAPEERATGFVWRALVGPYMEHLCKKYLPRAAAVTSVSSGLANLYAERYHLTTETIRNSADFRADLAPSPVDPNRIRLVHSGTADAERNIVDLIDATERLGDRFSLDLYLLDCRLRPAARRWSTPRSTGRRARAVPGPDLQDRHFDLSRTWPTPAWPRRSARWRAWAW